MSKPTLAAVLIAKNEEVMLANCLDSLKGIDAIYITDTGSQDKTVDIAKQYTPNVSYFEWCDSFCKARNFAKQNVKEDWIISIDCDEYLHDLTKVREAIEEAEKIGALAVDVLLISADHVNQKHAFPRIFKNDKRVWWEGAIHNHISVPGAPIGEVKITYGYSPAHHNDPDRAFRILKKEVEETGNGREIFYLGREYFYRQEWQSAIDTMSRYVEVSKFLAEKAEAFLVMARAYWALRKPDEARNMCTQALIINPDFAEALMFMSDSSWPRQAARWRSFARLADNSDVLFVRKTRQVLFLSPHDDDNVLFGAFICQREKPLVLVCLNSHIQPNRGEIGCDAETRAKETLAANYILGCQVERLNLQDDNVTEAQLLAALESYKDYDVYIPALQGGNPHHDMIHKVAMKVFKYVAQYTTYTKTELYTTGRIEIVPTQEELALKNRALECYQSQLNLASTRPHFNAILGKSEWLL